MKSLLKLLTCCALGCAAAFAGTITVGAPGNANDGDCAPFGCVVQYQQVYGAGQFSGPITITGLTFFNNNFVPGDIAPANYSISLSTTAAAVNGLSSTFASNLGADNALFFADPLGGTIGAANQFTINGTPFAYNPSNGNLLLSITSDGDGLQFSVFLDFLSGAPAGTFSRISSFDTSGVADTVQDDTGLVTQFTFADVGATVPEPTAIGLIIVGLVGLAVVGCLRQHRMND